nr:MAG TPA: hypothetical protein [Caudoviricetes sp.]
MVGSGRGSREHPWPFSFAPSGAERSTLRPGKYLSLCAILSAS